MFFFEKDLTFEIIGVYKISRDKNIHESYQRQYSSLSIRLMGNSDFVFGDKTYAVSGNDVLYLPYVSHYKQMTENETIISIHFITYNSPPTNMEVYRFEEIDEIKGLFSEIYNTWTSKEQGYKYLCTSLFYKLIYLINLASDESSTTNSIFLRIKPACDYIHQNYKKEVISVAELAKKVYMSEPAFRKNFKKVYLVSPNKYIRLLRLENASKLLQTTNSSISEIAALSGFDDTKYFSKQFHKRYGLSPKDYKLKYNKPK